MLRGEHPFDGNSVLINKKKNVEGEEEDTAVRALLRVVPSLDCISLLDDLVDRIAVVRDTANPSDEDINGELHPVVAPCNIPGPVVGG